ncbi:MAG: hypothetical protein JWO19_2073 [Bryobacterales bacterium]|nr:hypothetical protein [Bryobacterales bacterium]
MVTQVTSACRARSQRPKRYPLTRDNAVAFTNPLGGWETDSCSLTETGIGPSPSRYDVLTDTTCLSVSASQLQVYHFHDESI